MAHSRACLEKSTPQRGEVRRENRATAVFLCVLPISRGSNFLLARKRNTAEGGSTQRIPGHRCLPLRPSHLSRFKFPAGPKTEHRRGGSTQRIPGHRCLPLRPSDLSRFKFPASRKEEHRRGGEVRRQYRATAVFLCVLPVTRGSNFLLARRRRTAEGGSTQRIPGNRCLPLRPSHLSRFKFPAGPKTEHRRGGKCAENTGQLRSFSPSFPSLAVKISCWPENGTPQRGEVRRENRATAVFLCVLPISRGSSFLLARKRSTAEGGSAQRTPGNRCLSLRPSHLSRFKFPASRKEEHRRGGKYAEKTGQLLSFSASFPSLAVQISCQPEGGAPQRGEVRRENWATAVFLSVLPISRG